MKKKVTINSLIDKIDELIREIDYYEKLLREAE